MVRLTRAEYWLLEAVVETGLPVTVLGSPELEEVLNKPTHGLGKPELVELLNRLRHNGWIEFPDPETDDPVTPTIAQIQDSLDRPACFDPYSLVYRLTTLGGEVWEEFARPDWERYIEAFLPAGEPIGAYIGGSRSWLERYLQLVHHLGIQIKSGSERWSIVHPWQATYWRELPIGYRIEFEYEDRQESISGWDEIPHEVMFLQKWYNWE